MTLNKREKYLSKQEQFGGYGIHSAESAVKWSWYAGTALYLESSEESLDPG